MTDRNSVLAFCPFCGGDARYGRLNMRPAIYCVGGNGPCGAKLENSYDQDEMVVYAKWNRRTPVEPVLPSEASTSSVCRIDLDKKGVDDVAIAPVEMFRLERMSATSFWVCAYLPGSDQPRHVFWLNSRATITATHTDETFRAKQGADVAAEGQDNPSSGCTSSISPQEQGIREALEAAADELVSLVDRVQHAGRSGYMVNYAPAVRRANRTIKTARTALSSVGRGGGE